MGTLPDLTPLFYLAIVGMIAIAVTIVLTLWWLWNHVSFVVS